MSNGPEDPEELPEEAVEPEAFVPRADSYVADWAANFTMGHSDDRMFFIDFRRPDFRGFQSESDIQIAGVQTSVATLTLPPKATKELHQLLGTQIERYEEQFGEIEIEEDEENDNY